MNDKVLKIAGLAVTIGGAALTVLGNIISEKQQNKIIDEKITKAVSEIVKK